MKPVNFEYSRPRTVEEACGLLASDDNARPIAGGQTLIPMLAMRLARPTRLVDIARIPELSGITEGEDSIVIGATTRQAVAERHPLVRSGVPLLARALPWVGHAPTRARGTVGGSIANGDPAAEIALIAVTLAAAITVREGGDESDIPGNEFYFGPMITAAPAGGLVTRVSFPVWGEGRIGTGFHEVSARQSDFAFASGAAQVALDEEGVCIRIAAGVGGACDMPVRLDGLEDSLVGQKLDEETVREAVAAAAESLETVDDLHASAKYRKRVAATLARRAILDARDQALKLGARNAG